VDEQLAPRSLVTALVESSPGLPTGTVTLLLGDVEGSTRLWEADPDAMRAAVEHHDTLVAETISRHHGIRPVDQGEGDSFFAVFERASDAVACALDLQRSSAAPLRVRLGIHTGEVTLRGEGNYAGPTVNRHIEGSRRALMPLVALLAVIPLGFVLLRRNL